MSLLADDLSLILKKQSKPDWLKLQFHLLLFFLRNKQNKSQKLREKPKRFLILKQRNFTKRLKKSRQSGIILQISTKSDKSRQFSTICDNCRRNLQTFQSLIQESNSKQTGKIALNFAYGTSYSNYVDYS